MVFDLKLFDQLWETVVKELMLALRNWDALVDETLVRFRHSICDVKVGLQQKMMLLLEI